MDPGRAMISGKWADVGAFKVPTLRGLAARAPYFHDGSAARVEDVVAFYDRRFRIGFTAQERADLAAFLKAL
jgi:cytochrome c peroxidase